MTTVATSIFGPRTTGWLNRPQDVKTACAVIAARQGTVDVRVLAGPLFRVADDDGPRPLWLAEEKIKGGPQKSWDQRQAGTCVSFGWGRGINDLMCVEIAAGEAEEYPGADVATEPIYGGSRVEVGGGRINPNEDGSVGAWAAEFVSRWGILLRQQYGKYDLTKYSEQTSRQWGAHGVPDELEPECRKHPVRTVALVTSSADAWTLLGHGYPIPVCSNVGFDSPLVEGFCQPAGSWGHCVPPDAVIAGERFGRADEVTVGDRVYGRDGMLHTVTEVHRRRYRGPVVRIKPVGGLPLQVTEEHPVLVYRPVKARVAVLQTAGAVEEADRTPGSMRYRDTRYQPVWVTARDVRPGDYLATPALIAGNGNHPDWPACPTAVKPIPPLKVDADVAWMMGFYVGDGNRKKGHGVSFTLGKGKPLGRLLTAIARLGVTPRVREHPTFYRVSVDSVVIERAFVEWFGAYSCEKRLPGWLLSGPFAADALQGLVDADGCRLPPSGIRVNTTSPALREQVRMLASSMGHRVCCAAVRRGPGAYANAAPSWAIDWWPTATRSTVRRHEHLSLYKVKSVMLLPYDGEVFNFEVEDTHDYVADGYVVHNCMLLRGRLLAKYRGSVGKAFVIQNSWGDYLAGQGEPAVTLADGSTLRLPPGCFCVTDRWADQILRQQDSFAISNFRGFETRTLDWLL